MKQILKRVLFGRNNLANGLIAMFVVAAVALGCTCGKGLDFGNISRTSDNSANTSNSSPSNSATTGSKPDASAGLIPPDDDQLQYLARETMLDFNDAIQKEDFTDFHSKICKPWQKQVTPDGMKTMFRQFIDGEADFGEIRDMDAVLTLRKVKKEGSYKILEVNGEYPTTPNTTKFELNYLAEGKDWKLSKIRVETNIKLR
jgi:hypothetical protein